MTDQHFAIFDTAIGHCGIVWGARGVIAVQLPMSSEDKTRGRIRQRYGDIAEAPPSAEVQSAIDGIVELLAGKPNDLTDVVLDGTSLQGADLRGNRRIQRLAEQIAYQAGQPL